MERQQCVNARKLENDELRQGKQDASRDSGRRSRVFYDDAASAEVPEVRHKRAGDLHLHIILQHNIKQ